MLGTAFSATYMQDFTYADGTTDLGDGSTIGSAVGGTAGTIASVQSNELRLTQVNTNSQHASYRIPALANSSLGWTATFTLTLRDAVGGNPPADGFTFNYGDIQALTDNGTGTSGHGNAEAGMGGTVISYQVDTWNNGIAGGSGGPGVGILQGGAELPGGRLDGIVVPTDGTVSGSVTITWTPTDTSYVTTGLNTNAAFSDLAHTFTGLDSYGWAFSARTGGATEDLLIDNLVITTVAPVPEPGGWITLLGLGVGTVLLRRNRP